MFKDRYSIKKRGNKTIIPDDKLSWLYIFTLIMFAFLAIALVVISDEDLSFVLIICGFFLVSMFLFIWALEKKYIIAPQYIAIKHGLFCKKIRFNKMTSYSSYSYDSLSIYYGKSREHVIEYTYLASDAKNCFLNALKENNIPKETYSDSNANFKLRQKGALIGGSIFLFGLIFINYIFWEYHDSSTNDTGQIILGIAMLLLWNILLFFGLVSQIYTINVHDKVIEARVFGIKIKSINVNDISYYSTEYVTHRSRSGSYTVNELTIQLGEKDFRVFLTKINRSFYNYDRLIGYLRANSTRDAYKIRQNAAVKNKKKH